MGRIFLGKEESSEQKVALGIAPVGQLLSLIAASLDVSCLLSVQERHEDVDHLLMSVAVSEPLLANYLIR